MFPELCIVILFGLCFGSLNTLLAHRLPHGQKIGMTRSQCPKCKTTLGVYDLIPVFSWLLSKGRCRHCSTKVHWRYPATEIVTAASFAMVYAFHGFSVTTLLLCLLASQIVVLCIIDFEYRIIPDELQLGIGALGLMYRLHHEVHISEIVLGMFAGMFIGFALQQGFRHLRKKDGLGTGDVKFMTVSGIWLGVEPLLPYFFYAGILGIFSAMLWKLVNNDPRFPFGPALALSLFLLVLYPASEQWFVAISMQFVTILGVI